MFKRSLTLLLAFLVLNLSFATIAVAQVQNEKDAQRERDVEILVNRLGVGEKSRVKVSLKDDSKSVKGYISEISDDSFVVTDKKKNTNTRLQYSSVKKVSKDMPRTFLILGVAIIAIVIAVGACVAAGPCDE